MGRKKLFLGCLLLGLFGCSDKEEEYIRIENNLSMYETVQMLADSIKTKDVIIQENDRETGFVTYDTFKCDVKKNRRGCSAHIRTARLFWSNTIY